MSGNNNKTGNLLQSLEGIEKMQAPDFFYTRLQARMEKELLDEPKPFILLRPAFLTGCLAMVFAFNIITLVNEEKGSANTNKSAATIESFAREYNMNASGELYE